MPPRQLAGRCQLGGERRKKVVVEKLTSVLVKRRSSPLLEGKKKGRGGKFLAYKESPATPSYLGKG